MAEDIKYIGVDPDYTQSPKENNAVSKTKKNKSETKEKFRINKHNSKVDNFIASTKPKYKHTGKLIIVLLILLFVWIFKPINFLKTKLEEKRIHYSMQEDSSSVNLDIKFGLWNNILYYLSYNYYKDLRGTIIVPVKNYTLNAHYDLGHMGVDLNGYDGQEVIAAYDGIVVQTGFDSKYKNYVMIKHIIKGYDIYTYYGNLNTINAYEGQYVNQGHIIGTISGTQTGTGVLDENYCHLHFAVRKDLKESSGMDPMLFIYK